MQMFPKRIAWDFSLQVANRSFIFENMGQLGCDCCTAEKQSLGRVSVCSWSSTADKPKTVGVQRTVATALMSKHRPLIQFRKPDEVHGGAGVIFVGVSEEECRKRNCEVKLQGVFY